MGSDWWEENNGDAADARHDQYGLSSDIEEKPTEPFNASDDEGDDDDYPPVQHRSRQGARRADGRVLARRGSVGEILNGLGKSGSDDLHPALERRIRDFRFAQQKREEKYGSDRPFGILGLYDHLASIRIDLEWAEDAAWRRQHNEPYLSWSDFEKARAKGSNRPFFTYFILLFSTVMVFASIAANEWQIESLNVNPMIGPSAETLLELGAKQSSLIVTEGEWFRLFSPMVLHAGLIHYTLNMLVLWFVGSAIEKSHGSINAAITFIIAGVGGTVLSAIFLPQYISVGASGGIFGFIGMCVSDIVVNWNLLFVKEDGDDKDHRFRHTMVLLWLMVDILVNLVIGLTPFVDNFTHLGGFVYGFLCGLSTIERLEVGFFGVATTAWEKFRNNLVRFSGLILSVVLIMVTTILLVESDGATSPCNNCRYVSCVPFPPWQEDRWWYCDDCDQVTADAHKRDASSPIFDSLDLTCPNGDIVRIDIVEDGIGDTDVLLKALSGYCRNNCNDVFNAARF